MKESEFVALVEQARPEVSPAPVGAILARGRQRSRRGRAALIGAVASVVVMAGTVAALTTDGRPSRPEPLTPTPSSAELVPPKGMRYVRFGDYAIAVPGEWGTNEVGCDGVTAVRPSVVFTDADQPLNRCLVLVRRPMLRVHRSADWDHAFISCQSREVNDVPICLVGPSLTKDGFQELGVGIVGHEFILTIRTRSLVDDRRSTLGYDILATLTRSAAER